MDEIQESGTTNTVPNIISVVKAHKVAGKERTNYFDGGKSASVESCSQRVEVVSSFRKSHTCGSLYAKCNCDVIEQPVTGNTAKSIITSTVALPTTKQHSPPICVQPAATFVPASPDIDSVQLNINNNSSHKNNHPNRTNKRRQKLFQSFSHPDTSFVFTDANDTDHERVGGSCSSATPTPDGAPINGNRSRDQVYASKSGKFRISCSERSSTPNIGKYTILDVHPEVLVKVSHRELKKQHSEPVRLATASRARLTKQDEFDLSSQEELLSPTKEVLCSSTIASTQRAQDPIECLFAGTNSRHHLHSYPGASVELTKRESLAKQLSVDSATLDDHSRTAAINFDYLKYTALAYQQPIANHNSAQHRYFQESGILGPMGNGIGVLRKSSKVVPTANAAEATSPVIDQIRRNSIRLGHTTKNELTKKLSCSSDYEFYGQPTTPTKCDDSHNNLWAIKAKRLQEEVNNLRELMKMRDDEQNKLKREIHKLKSVLHQTTSHMRLGDGDLLSSLQTHHCMAGQHAIGCCTTVAGIGTSTATAAAAATAAATAAIAAIAATTTTTTTTNTNDNGSTIPSAVISLQLPPLTAVIAATNAFGTAAVECERPDDRPPFLFQFQNNNNNNNNNNDNNNKNNNENIYNNHNNNNNNNNNKKNNNNNEINKPTRRTTIGPLTIGYKKHNMNININDFPQATAAIKKQGVSGESYDTTGQHSFDIQIPKFEKDFRSKQLIKDAIMDNDFLKNIDSLQVRELVESMYCREITCGEYVVREGEAGAHLYVSAIGEFEVIKDGTVLGIMGPGKAFGELAILYNCTRTASIRVLSDAKIWVLDRRVFQQIMMRTGMQRIEENVSFLRSVPLFKDLADDVLAKIADVLEVEFYSTGTYIIRQDATGDTFFLISQGTVKVTQRLPGKTDEEEIRILGRGDYFGEQALIKEDKRTANVVASEPGVECLTLDRVSFTQLIGDLCELHEKDYGDQQRVLACKNAAILKSIECKQELLDVELNDLERVATLGIGGFGRVELVKHVNVDDGMVRAYALKCLKKQHIVDTRQEEHVFSERIIMLSCNTPFICRLFRTYRDNKYVYMLLEACMGGEVWTILRDRGYFDDRTAQFIIGCVLQAFEHLHARGIVYRDLKPENLMLDTRGYIKLVDFGFSKFIGYSNKTWTFCGTPEYVAPEIVLNKGHDRAVDYWAIGVLIHELLTGTPPFTASDPMKTYNIILKGIDMVDFPRHMSRSAVSLIKRLCRDVPVERLGYQRGGILDIKKHKWFLGFDWDSLENLTLAPPIIQPVAGPLDASNFDSFPIDTDIPPDEFSGWDAEF